MYTFRSCMHYLFTIAANIFFTGTILNYEEVFLKNIVYSLN